MKEQIERLTFYSNATYCPVRAEAAEALVTHGGEAMLEMRDAEILIGTKS